MRRWPVILGVVLALVVGALLVGALAYTSQPSFCSSCHAIAPFAASWEASSHRAVGVTCTECHFEPGAVGYVKGKAYSLIKLGQWVFGETERKPEASRAVVGGACRHCHADPTSTFIPHSFHTEQANLECTECHSGVVHGSALVGAEKAQARNDPDFCRTCHKGDIAPILFDPIPLAGREHPGAPKIDVNVWRNIHWRMADGPAVIDGYPYDKIQRETCLVCHDDPTRARACKGCHFARVPQFRLSASAERLTFFPLGLAAVALLFLVVAGVLSVRRKLGLFSSRWMMVLVGLVVASDVFVLYGLIVDALTQESGSVELGATTVWISYLLLSVALVLLVLFESVIKPRSDRLLLLPCTPEEEMLVQGHEDWLEDEGVPPGLCGGRSSPAQEGGGGE